jgi:hypothetical protein
MAKYGIINLIAGISIFSLANLISVIPARAALQVCRMKPTMVTTDRNGTVFLQGLVGTGGNVGTIGIQWQAVCSVNAVYQNVTIESCKSWVAAAMTAQASGKNLFMFFYDQNNGGRTDCSQFPAWTPPYIDYLGIENP